MKIFHSEIPGAWFKYWGFFVNATKIGFKFNHSCSRKVIDFDSIFFYHLLTKKDKKMQDTRFEKQIKFINEIEKLKTVYRRNMTIDKKRAENSAEHSWNVALLAVVLGEYSNDEIDISKVILMLLIHDLVEIDTGDTWLYDDEANKSKQEKEEICAQRIFGLLPDDQKKRFIDLWHEFEERKTKEAVFAASIDNLHPMINHLLTGGDLIVDDKVKVSKIIEKKKFIEKGSKKLWQFAQEVIQKSLKAGLYIDE